MTKDSSVSGQIAFPRQRNSNTTHHRLLLVPVFRKRPRSLLTTAMCHPSSLLGFVSIFLEIPSPPHSQVFAPNPRQKTGSNGSQNREPRVPRDACGFEGARKPNRWPCPQVRRPIKPLAATSPRPQPSKHGHHLLSAGTTLYYCHPAHAASEPTPHALPAALSESETPSRRASGARWTCTSPRST
jgi:hypothetical protein